MWNNFKALTISYKHAPLEIREAMSLDEGGCKKLMLSLREYCDSTDMLIMSTCNRTEIYYTSANDYSSHIIKILCLQKGISDFEAYLPHFKVISDHKEAVLHLFNVSIGLESQVVGDMQITNQAKNAYQWSADIDMAGPFLHRLMHTIFFTNKKVVQETSFRDGAASVSYATAELAEELCSQLVNPKVLVVGLGEMGADVCRNLQDSDAMVSITNRTLSKAEELAKECFNAKVVPFENMWDAVKEADVIISSVSRDEPLITKDKVAEVSEFSFKYFIDIAVPRSVAPEVEEIPCVVVYHIDNIQNRASEALQKRLDSIPRVQEIIGEAIVEFNEWSKDMEVSPTINKLKKALEQIRQEEMARYMRQLNDTECKKVDLITKNIMQKIIKLPVLQLKAACRRGEAETLIDVLNDLFNLDQQEEEAK
ncbi:glutamyl-tRNA reductase [Cytophagaceae bacterium ABcell3]|nr:glutamyl-tRNA reductase [Cytophagaceae bacterium ABcell3]